jgi:hypothetical protein
VDVVIDLPASQLPSLLGRLATGDEELLQRLGAAACLEL